MTVYGHPLLAGAPGPWCRGGSGWGLFKAQSRGGSSTQGVSLTVTVPRFLGMT